MHRSRSRRCPIRWRRPVTFAITKVADPLAPANLDDPIKLRDAVQTVTLLALRAVGVMDARARGLVVQATTPAKALVGA